MPNVTGTSSNDSVTRTTASAGVTGGPATPGSDTILGLAGFDTLYGADGDDSIDGGADGDSLFGESGNDTLVGDDGADVLDGGNANDSIEGGAGNDTLSDTHLVSGPASTNTLLGGAGNDLLSFGIGATGILDGGAGNDTIIPGFASATLVGGADSDVFVFRTAAYGMHVITDFTAGAGGDRINLSDMLMGNFPGYSGGNPFQLGYLRVRQDGANAFIDVDTSGGGDSFVAKIRLDNVLAAALTADNFTPGYGPDDPPIAGHLITGTSSGDSVTGTTVSAGVTGAPATLGNDTILGLAGFDTLYGSDGGDSIDGGADNDRLHGELGHDTLVGGDGADVLDGGKGNDLIEGGAGNDTIQEGFVVSDAGTANILLGGAGNDSLSFSNGATGTIDGGAGNDTIVLGYSSTTVAGGADADRFVFYSDSSGLHVITDFTTGAGGDRIELAPIASYGFTGYTGGNPFQLGYLRVRQDGADAFIDVDTDGGGDGFVAKIRLDNVLASALTADNFTPGYNPDGSPTPGRLITGTPSQDAVRETTVSPGVTGGPATLGNDTILGLAGFDTLFGSNGDDRIDGGADDDRLYGELGHDTLIGGDGADFLDGGRGDDSVEGGAGDDTLLEGSIDSNATGASTLLGGAGNDSLGFQFSATGLLDGGAGNDTISPSLGSATLTGGADADRFLFYSASSGLHVITDFTAGTGGDRIELSQMLTKSFTGYSGGNPFQLGYLRVRQDGADAFIDVDTNGGGDGFVAKIRLDNVLAFSLTVDNFIPQSNPWFGIVITGTSARDSVTSGSTSAGVIGGPSTPGNDTIQGFGGSDTLHAADGNDSLDGGRGSDSLDGGAGDDIYAVNNSGDTLVEAEGGGTDTVQAAVNWTLGAEFEVLVLTGKAENGTGNALGNHIIGTTRKNTLDGQGGNDTLHGGEGGDTLFGGDGTDTLEGEAGRDSMDGGAQGDVFRWANPSHGRDTIGGFVAMEDRLAFSAAGFGGGLMEAVPLTMSQFETNATGMATGTAVRFIYNSATGALAFDADGSGAGVALHIVTLTGLPTLTAADLIIGA